ncbi:MAG: FAD-dependent oxidoreductase [Chloroflexia bacterium]|nr:FAD-dependent oxidoreductase [Chloroflexia bacterium]
MSAHIVVLGGTLAGVRAARRLAAAGLEVTLLEPSPFLGGDLAGSLTDWMSAAPDLFEAAREPQIHLMTQSTVQNVARHPDGLQLVVQQEPRYVDLSRCTACGECVLVCPVAVPVDSAEPQRRAIYRLPLERSAPNVYAIQKRGEAPCSHTCPGGIHVQGYVALVAQGKFLPAYDLICQAIPFPGICGRVCHHPCEAECSRRDLDGPVAVRPLKRFVADYAVEHGHTAWEAVEPDPDLAPVAVIGAGPAGLTVAWELARQGVRATVFEALPVAGGMMAVGIPAYRLPRQDLQREIEAIEALGVEICLNTPLGPELTLDELFDRGYGAVFLGLGAHRGRELGVPGEDLCGVVPALDLLRSVSMAQWEGLPDPELPAHLQQDCAISIGRRAAVIGGGNTAVDSARSLLRLGAEGVYILYRRSRQEMPCLPEEIDAAEEEGAVLEILVTPKRILGQDGRVTAIECLRMELGEPDESGRRRPIPIPGSEFTLEVDMVVPAIGQQLDLPPQLKSLCDERGGLCVDPETGCTPRAGVFAAGDVVRVRSVIDAVGEAKRAAENILHYLRDEELSCPTAEAERTVAHPPAEELEAASRETRHNPIEIPLVQRQRSFAEVECVLTEEEALAEAGRCLACGICSECMECVAVCEPQAIHHEARPRHLTLEADAVLLANGQGLPPMEGVYRLQEGDPEAMVRAMLTAFGQEQARPSPLRQRLQPAASEMSRLGIFLCRCGEQIAGAVDLDVLQARLSKLPHVVRVEQVRFACLPEGIEFLRQASADLDGAVLAACSCCNLAQTCYSCTSQRVRCREGLGLWQESLAESLPSWAWEFVNLREHCAWVHGPEDALETAGDYIAAAAARLRADPLVPLVARVDAALCRACGTCESLCQAEAIRLEVDAQGRLCARVDESRCLACGTCAAHCPTGAVVAGRVSDRQIEATVEAMGYAGPAERVVVFACNWGGHSGAEALGMQHRQLPAEVRTVRVPCLGRLSPGLLLRTLELGAAGVLLAGCHEDSCRFEFGREWAGQALQQAQVLADLVGLGAQRLDMVGIAPGDAETLAQALERFVRQLTPEQLAPV